MSRSVVMGVLHRAALITYVFLCMKSVAHGWGLEGFTLTRKFINKPPFLQGDEVSFRSSLKPTFSSLKVAQDVELIWEFNNLIKYRSHDVQQPSNVSEVTLTSNKLTVKISSLQSNETIQVVVNVAVDPNGTFSNSLMNFVPVGFIFKYKWQTCSPEITYISDVEFPFFSPACSSSGSLTIKDSSFKVTTVKSNQSINVDWTPMTSFNLLDVNTKMKINFVQVDLKSPKDLIMAAIHGVSRFDLYPTNIVKMSFSDNQWKWKMRSGLQRVWTIKSDVKDTVIIAITLNKPYSSRYARINIPPYGNTQEIPTTYEFDFFACDPNSALPNSQETVVQVGIESSALVPDSKMTAASSASPLHSASMARLNTKVSGGAWCASSCNPLQYLQIDLTEPWEIVEVETQSQHWTSGNINAVKTYSMSYSHDGSTWNPYMVNGETKFFWGNEVANIATRHKLVTAITAKFVRFEPRTCINNPCMRVELYGTKVKNLPKKEIPRVMERLLLVEKTANIAYVCITEVVKGKPTCHYTEDKGVNWKGIPKKILNVIAHDPIRGLLYGISRSGKNFMRSHDSLGRKWKGIPERDWKKIKDSGTLITALHIPFVPVSRSEIAVVDPIVVFNSANGDRWLADQVSVYHEPIGILPKVVLSFLPSSTDLSSNVCHTGVCVHGRCEPINATNFNCKCRLGYVGKHCDKEIDECSSSPCLNGATCVDELLMYKCSCLPGYSGDRCESKWIKVDEQCT